ncbi:BTB/POZ domain-containing protein 10-like [Dysidea avara]|uniref:BTB/POZ domain-containing protein 10-like n=1 Tax=Dysidea avara TaxID=196820 RepID=UPI003317818E
MPISKKTSGVISPKGSQDFISESPRHHHLQCHDSSSESLKNSRSSSTTSLSGTPEPFKQDNERVILLVDGKKFRINRSLLTKYPDTMLGKMFGPSMDRHMIQTNEYGEYEVAKGIPSRLFAAILEYYKSGYIVCPDSQSVQELRETCDYFMIPFSEKTVKTNNLRDFMHELSNDGAREQFESLLAIVIVPAMIKCARKGERECHLVALHDDDVIEWDDQNPPNMGEDQIQTVYSTDLNRFFKYFDNRDIAKEVLQERGLKKIKFGIEGYPTTKDKMRVRHTTGRTEAVYNYVQRPYIHMSWEKEEHKSRHVDFTCVKVKTDIDPDAEAATLVDPERDRNLD